jgi:hypothetical protein
MADGFYNNKRRWLWVPAFAGTTKKDDDSYTSSVTVTGT